MATPENKGASELIRQHFAEVSSDQFRANLARYSPELLEFQLASSSADAQEKPQMNNQLQLLPYSLPTPHSAPLPLSAYLASPLTGLSPDQRQLIFHLSDSVGEICREFGIDLYEPRKKTDPVHHADVADSEVFRVDREKVVGSDLLIFLAHYPSVGAGEELDFAYNALVPIIIISHQDTRVSRMVTGLPALGARITYEEPEEFRDQLRERLAEIRPILEERKLAFANYDVNLVGERIRLRREALGFTREQVASARLIEAKKASDDDKIAYLSVESLAAIEEGTDRISNPSLLQLRQIAATLGTTVADLVEPDLNERLLAVLQDWVSGRQAARDWGSAWPSIKDRNKLLRRVLYRLMDSLEEE
jgi:transcriptional regulator with XRE-family HTH domain